jgi:hypothetical protein|tara:strand:+ start:2738 stop:2908 length:171 start_codon:yes stop_codon:yes gene_type:complete
MSIGQTYKYKAQRNKLNADTDAFLAAGGVIQHLPYGIKQENRVSFNNHNKNNPSKK